jgi:hypothetical protein
MSTTLPRTPGHATEAQRASTFGLGHGGCFDKPKPVLGSLDRRLGQLVSRHRRTGDSRPVWRDDDAWRPGEEVTFCDLSGNPRAGVVWSFGASNSLRLVIPDGLV